MIVLPMWLVAILIMLGALYWAWEKAQQARKDFERNRAKKLGVAPTADDKRPNA